jgi:hypothetical protein
MPFCSGVHGAMYSELLSDAAADGAFRKLALAGESRYAENVHDPLRRHSFSGCMQLVAR